MNLWKKNLKTLRNYRRYVIYADSKQKKQHQSIMTSQNKISPLQLTTEIKKIYNGHSLKDFDFQNRWSEIENIFIMAKIMVLPKPHIHGKKCSNCRHSMHCKSIECPNCFKEQRKRKRIVPAVPQLAPVEVAEIVLITVPVEVCEITSSFRI